MSKPDRTISPKVKQTVYHPDRHQFELVFDPLEIEGLGVLELRVSLPEHSVRQMAEVLPPADPETVH